MHRLFCRYYLFIFFIFILFIHLFIYFREEEWEGRMVWEVCAS